jgi:hypothetical protein
VRSRKGFFPDDKNMHVLAMQQLKQRDEGKVGLLGNKGEHLSLISSVQTVLTTELLFCG